MIFMTSIFGAFFGCIVGVIWAFGLGLDFKSGLLYGGLIGAILAFGVSILQKGILNRGNLQKNEVGFVTGSFFTLIAGIGVVTGLIAWAIRVLFL